MKSAGGDADENGTNLDVRGGTRRFARCLRVGVRDRGRPDRGSGVVLCRS